VHLPAVALAALPLQVAWPMRSTTVAIAGASVPAIGLGTMLPECAHLLAGTLAGGDPTLLTATEVHRDFSALTPAGFATGLAQLVPPGDAV
jgi:hypothetical protein